MAEDFGWLDTNIFIHAQTRDRHSDACRRVMNQLAGGEAKGRIDPVVAHELTYALMSKFGFTKRMAADYINMILTWEGVEVVGGKEPMISAICIWQEQNIGFADALLAARAMLDGTQVLTVNVRHIAAAGASAVAPE